MKKLMNIMEFRRYTKTANLGPVMYRSDNQEWFRDTDPIRFKVTCTIREIRPELGLIVLSSRDGSEICFSRVVHIGIDTECSVLGTVITLICKNGTCRNSQIAYKLIALA